MAKCSSNTSGKVISAGMFGVLYDVERQAQEFDIDARRATRQQLGKPAADTLHAWLLAQLLADPRVIETYLGRKPNTTLSLANLAMDPH